ncbi:MAG: amidohydrolase family protein, partial [Desulfofustis sp.]
MKIFGAPAFPDLILYNGTVNGLTAQSLVIDAGRIVAVGSDNDLKRLAGERTETVNLDGRLVLPGFIDTHIHFHEWALKRKDLQLDTVSSLEVLLDRLLRQAARFPPSEWIIGQGLNETGWPEKRLPTRAELDRVVPDHPLLLWRCDLHLAVANSAGLARASIDKETPDPPQGKIERDDNGTPTGVVRELAINLIRDTIEP